MQLGNIFGVLVLVAAALAKERVTTSTVYGTTNTHTPARFNKTLKTKETTVSGTHSEGRFNKTLKTKETTVSGTHSDGRFNKTLKTTPVTVSGTHSKGRFNKTLKTTPVTASGTKSEGRFNKTLKTTPITASGTKSEGRFNRTYNPTTTTEYRLADENMHLMEKRAQNGTAAGNSTNGTSLVTSEDGAAYNNAMGLSVAGAFAVGLVLIA